MFTPDIQLILYNKHFISCTWSSGVFILLTFSFARVTRLLIKKCFVVSHCSSQTLLAWHLKWAEVWGGAAVRTELSKVSSLKPRFGNNRAFHASSTVMSSAYRILSSGLIDDYLSFFSISLYVYLRVSLVIRRLVFNIT